jgi:carbon storage regulator
MLALSRKPGEQVVIGNTITLTVVEVRGDRVRLAFDAPEQVRILRAELACRPGEPLDAGLDGRPG